MAVGHPSKSMHNVHVKASEGAESSGVTAFRNVACLVKYKQALSAGTWSQSAGDLESFGKNSL